MTLETAISVMKYNKELLGLPNGQGSRWSSNANTVACDVAIEIMEKELKAREKEIDEWNMRPRF